MDSELISIVVPVFNCEEYLPECIESILEQTYTNFELLLLNDGSSDSSEKVCLKYKAQDRRVKVVTHLNMGVSKTRKKGLDIAKGKYITFIDGDDAIKLNYLECLYDKINKERADIVCCNSIDSGIKNLGITEEKLIKENKEWLRAFFEGRRYAYCIWGKLYRKEILSNIEFPDMKYAEDTFIVLNAFKKAKKVVLIRYFGYLYRDNPLGAMRKSKGLQQPKDVLYLAKYIYEICRNSYSEFEIHASKYLINAIFNTLIEGSYAEQEEWLKVQNMVNQCLIYVQKKHCLSNVKGIVVLSYSRLPRVIYRILRTYKKVKAKKVKGGM